MNGYTSEKEDVPQQTGGARKQNKVARKTVKQRLAAKARRDARKMIKLTDTLPQEVSDTGFHYNEDSSREILEESRELGNQSDDEMPNPVIKQHSLEYRVVANKRPGGKPVVQVKGLRLDYDNTQSPFVSAAYLDNGQIATGVLNTAAAASQATSAALSPIKQQIPKKPRKKLMRKRTAKRLPSK
jgi:hypothetical protein